jgi:hypothetical protein
VPTLACALTNKPNPMRLLIAMHLGDMGPKAIAAVPVLQTILASPEPELRR